MGLETIINSLQLEIENNLENLNKPITKGRYKGDIRIDVIHAERIDALYLIRGLLGLKDDPFVSKYRIIELISTQALWLFTESILKSKRLGYCPYGRLKL